MTKTAFPTLKMAVLLEVHLQTTGFN